VGAGPSQQDRARRIGVDYLIGRYRPPQSALRVDSVTRTGDDFVVVATIVNRSAHRLIVDLRRERVVSENVTYPSRPEKPFTDLERARTFVTRYLTDKYKVPARDLNIERSTDLGRLVRVSVAIKGIGVRAIDVDPRSGAVVADRRG
jgi:hypothetical protein